MFNNENIKYFRKIERTDEFKLKIIQMSIEHGLLSPYVGLIGIRQFSTQKKKNKTTNIIKNLRDIEINKNDDDDFTALNVSKR